MKPVLRGSLVCADDMELEPGSVKLWDLGFMGYAEAHEIQLECVNNQIGDICGSETILITEHPPVFTLGRKGNLSGLLRSRAQVEGDGVEIIHTERGGDITYHGPGQIVVYPIINLRKRKLSVSDFVYKLEQIMLDTTTDSGVHATRDERNRGIWIGDNKLGSIGIRIRHGVTFHGLALNVNLALDPFRWIEPCGLSGVGVTSLKKEIGRQLDMGKVKRQIQYHIAREFCQQAEVYN